MSCSVVTVQLEELDEWFWCDDSVWEQSGYGRCWELRCFFRTPSEFLNLLIAHNKNQIVLNCSNGKVHLTDGVDGFIVITIPNDFSGDYAPVIIDLKANNARLKEQLATVEDTSKA